MSIDLAGRSAVVTGASSGVGRAIAVALGAAGARVRLVGRDRARLEAAGAAVAAAFDAAVDAAARATGPARSAPRAAPGATRDPAAADRGSPTRPPTAPPAAPDAPAGTRRAAATLHLIDLADDAAIRSAAAELSEADEGLDILVHAAGAIAVGPVESAPVQDLDRQLHTNLRAPYLLTQLLLPALRARRGQIVFVNSAAGLNAPAGSSAYAASKSGLRALADALRAEVNPDGVRVVSVFLGRTATPMQAKLHGVEGRAYDPARLIQPEDVAGVIGAILALPRTVEVTDIRLRPGLAPRVRSASGPARTREAARERARTRRPRDGVQALPHGGAVARPRDAAAARPAGDVVAARPAARHADTHARSTR